VLRDVREYLLATGIRSGALFPRRDGAPWRLHDYNNWRRRVWKKARETAGVDPLPPYDLRHAFASLQIRPACRSPSSRSRWGTRRR
jgi:integrase